MPFVAFMTGLSNLRAATDRVGSLFDSDISPAQSELDAQADGNKERNRIYGENQALASGFSGEYTQQVVPPVMESFTDMSHSRIMQFVESIDIGQMSTSIQGWTQLANDTTAKATAFHDNISKEMERGWAGSAATQALASTKAYLADIHKVDQAARLIANKMDEARSGFQQVKYSVPHESDDQGDSKLGILVSVLSPATGKVIDSASAGRAEAAQAAAREVMRTVYQPVAQQSDTQVPKVPGPSKPQQDNPGNGDPGDGPGSGITNGDNNNTGGTPGTNPANTTAEPEDPTTTEPGDDEDSGDDSASSTEEPAATTPEDTTPASTPATNPAATTPAGTTPNGLGSGGGAGAGAGAGGGSPSVPGAGSSLPGAGGAAPGAGAGQKLAASAGGSAGRAGMPGMGGMGAPGARGGKDDENEHGAPDYLRGVHEELLGPDRAHVPPVIGGDA